MARPIPLSNSDLQSIDRALKILGYGRLGVYRVADLPAKGEPSSVFVIDALKAGESTGAGTGCPAYFDGSAWFRASDDTPISA